MSADYIFPNYIGLKNDKLKLGLNVVIPTRNGIVDKAAVVEIIAHELNHAYTTWHEIKQNHVSHPISIIATIKDYLSPKKHKYTFTDRLIKYNNIIPINSGSLCDDFRWVGYIGVRTEINAILAGIDAFLYEHNGKTSKLSQSRGYKTINIIYNKFKNLITNASDEYWKWAQKNATYIYNRKNESLSKFKNRYIKYYENIFQEFDKKIDKIIDKYNNKSDKFKSGKANILYKTTLKKTGKSKVK